MEKLRAPLHAKSAVSPVIQTKKDLDRFVQVLKAVNKAIKTVPACNKSFISNNRKLIRRRIVKNTVP